VITPNSSASPKRRAKCIMLRAQLAEAEALIEDETADRDFVNMAIEERGELKEKLPGHRARDAADAAAEGSRR
jgi:hypothetical protein